MHSYIYMRAYIHTYVPYVSMKNTNIHANICACMHAHKYTHTHIDGYILTYLHEHVHILVRRE